MFEKATRAKLRFSTAIGNMTVEDLWDLPLTSTRSKSVSLKDLAAALYKEQRESEVPDFVAMAVSGNPAAITSSSRSETDLKMEIVIHIIKTKAAEQEQKEAQAKKAEQRRAIHELLAAKQTEELSQKSSEELLKMLEEL